MLEKILSNHKEAFCLQHRKPYSIVAMNTQPAAKF
jgi:hypothetical protein